MDEKKQSIQQRAVLTKDPRDTVVVKTRHPRNSFQLVVLERRSCHQNGLLESRLRGLGTGNLDSLAKRLEPLLLPEYCLGERAMEHIHKGE